MLSWLLLNYNSKTELAAFGLSRNRFGLFFTIVAMFFEQVYPQGNIHAEMDDGRQLSLEGCLSVISRASD